MDQEPLAAGDVAIPNEAVEAALVACRRDEASGDVAMDSREFNDFVRAAAVAGVRSEDQQPRQASGNSGPRSGRVRTGATMASAAAARVRQHVGEQARQAPRSQFEGCRDDDDVKARDFREFDQFIKMHLQQRYTQQLLPRLQQSPSPSSTEGGGEVAPAPASLDLELRL